MWEVSNRPKTRKAADGAENRLRSFNRTGRKKAVSIKPGQSAAVVRISKAVVVRRKAPPVAQ